MRECLAHCDTRAGWRLGTSGETSANTLACRIHCADLARTQPAANCVFAGPTGGNMCGTWCENYCYLALRNCTAARWNAATSPSTMTGSMYADPMSCQDTCRTFDTSGDPKALVGNTVQCRINHLALAGGPGEMDANEQCPRALKAATSDCL